MLTPQDLFPRPTAAPPNRFGGGISGGPIDEIDDDEASTGPPPDHLIEPGVEALLFAAEGPMTVDQLNDWLEDPGPRRVREALHRLQTRLRQDGRGFRLVQVARGWQLRTDPRFSRWVAAMRGGKPMRLSKAALEALAVIAYRQPVTRTEVEALRGVDSGGVIRMLC
ncbi:MAG: SMC-Scp complex subunit ScpB, partial [Myxococcota bacterium]